MKCTAQCKQCSKPFIYDRCPSSIARNVGQYCSRSCRQSSFRGRPAWNKGLPMSPEDRAARDFDRTGSTHSAETRRKMSAVHRGRKFTVEHRRKIANARGGERSNFWRGGITPERKRIYNSAEYKIWRTAVFERDDYTCRRCGQRGGWLEAHHIKPFWRFPHLRFKAANGLTLCKPCHMKTDTYGHRALTNIPLPDPQAAGYISNY